jgi:hypothetical protein
MGYGGRGNVDMMMILKGGLRQETHLAQPSCHKIASHKPRLCKLTKLILGPDANTIFMFMHVNTDLCLRA